MIETFHIIPASPKGLWLIMALVLGTMLFATTLVGLSVYGARNSRFELSSSGLQIRGDAYGRSLAADQLRGGSARQIDLKDEPTLKPKRRLLGTAIGGYRSGWFRLANKEKALLYVTDSSQVIYIPTTAGYSIMLSVAEPERFLERLREIAPAE